MTIVLNQFNVVLVCICICTCNAEHCTSIVQYVCTCMYLISKWACIHMYMYIIYYSTCIELTVYSSALVLFLCPPWRTLSEGGYFKAHLLFPKEYPQRPPKMKFITDIWHPNGEHRVHYQSHSHCCINLYTVYSIYSCWCIVQYV